MSFDPDKHHRRSIRLQDYDYSQPGAYFITVCTHQKKSLFAEIRDGEIYLSPAGRIATKQWRRLPFRFPNLELGAFIIMPNHIHGILIISERDNPDSGRGTARGFEDHRRLQSRRAPTQEQFGKPVPRSIPTIIRSYKSSVSLRINRLRDLPDHPLWQRNYYEHIIRNELDFRNIHDYIETNPINWNLDQLNLANLHDPNNTI